MYQQHAGAFALSGALPTLISFIGPFQVRLGSLVGSHVDLSVYEADYGLVCFENKRIAFAMVGRGRSGLATPGTSESTATSDGRGDPNFTRIFAHVQASLTFASLNDGVTVHKQFVQLHHFIAGLLPI